VRVTATYGLSVEQPDELARAGQGRFADSDLTDLAAAIRDLVRSEGWEPNAVRSGGRIDVRQADVSIDVTP
jgi:hypothetical protein